MAKKAAGNKSSTCLCCGFVFSFFLYLQYYCYCHSKQLISKH